MTEDWATALTTKLLDNTPELKQVSLREIMAMALRAERERAISLAEDHHDDDGTGPDCQGCGEVIAARIRGDI